MNILAKTLYLLFAMAEEEICSKIDTRDITCTFYFFGKPKFFANLFMAATQASKFRYAQNKENYTKAEFE